MAMNNEVYDTLVSVLSIPAHVARIAASKFGNLEQAANWAFDNMGLVEGDEGGGGGGGEGGGNMDWGIGNEGPDQVSWIWSDGVV